MKIKKRIALVLPIFFFIVGCASTKIKYLKPTEFMEKAMTRENSASWETYIGKSRRRVYFEYGIGITLKDILGLSNKPDYIIYWTELDKVPKYFIERLEKDRKEFDELIENSQMTTILLIFEWVRSQQNIWPNR